MMSGNRSPRSFAQRLRAFADDIPAQQNELKKAVAMECGLQLIGATPVLSGRARCNWNTSLNASANDVDMVGPFDPGGDPALAEVRTVVNQSQPGDTIYFSNNLPYIVLLNQGSSKQAPAGFVEDAIETGRAIIARQRIRYKV